MTNSGTSTEAAPAAGRTTAGYQPWQFYMLLSLAAATVAVVVTKQTSPAALIVLSGAILATGVVAVALHYSLTGFFGVRVDPRATPLASRSREALEQDKALVLRAIKELEFDRAMKKIGDADFAELSARLRTRALEVMAELDRPAPGGVPAEPRAVAPTAAPVSADAFCSTCGAPHDPDANFCKSCGAKLR